MENNIFREMKKEKAKLIKEHSEYEKYNYLLKQTIQQLIQSNEKLLLGLKLRFEKIIKLSNQDFIMNTNISEKTKQVIKKEEAISEISEIEKKSIKKSIDRSEKELIQIKADLKIAQSSENNIFEEISDLQKKKEKLLKEQKELINSIKSLKIQNELNPSFGSFQKQFNQINDDNESLMNLRNQIFKIYKESFDKERQSLNKIKNGRFYLEPTKLLEVLSISQTPIFSLSSADNNEISVKTITDIESNIASSMKPPNASKNNENQNNNQIKTYLKNEENKKLIKNDDNNYQNKTNLISTENNSKNDFIDKISLNKKRKVIKYRPTSENDKSKLNTTTKNPKFNTYSNIYDDCYDSELQSISFPDQSSDHFHDNKHDTIVRSKPKNQSFHNNYSSMEEISDNSKTKKGISISSPKSTNNITTNTSNTNPKLLPKLNIDSTSRNGNEKHVLISPGNTERKHDNSSAVLLSPINVSLNEKTTASRNSLINIFNTGKSGNSSQSTPRVGGICKPSLSQVSSFTSQTTPSTPHKMKSSITFACSEKETNRNQEKSENKEDDQDCFQNKDKTKSNNKYDEFKEKIKNQFDEIIKKDEELNKEDQNNDDKNDNINDADAPLLSTLKSVANRINKSENISKSEPTNDNNEENTEELSFYTDQKSQTKDSFITKNKIHLFGLRSIDKKLTASNLELKVTDLEQEAIDLEEELVQINQTLMDTNPGSRSFRKMKRPVLRYDFNLYPLLIIDKNSDSFNVSNASTQSDESAPDLEAIKNQILQNSLNQSYAMMNQHKQELMKFLSTFEIELKVEKMNNSRRKIELNEELKRLKIVDPLMYYKELNIEPEEHVDDELALKRETVYSKEKLERRIEEVKNENENLLFRINDLTFVTNQLQKKLTFMSKEPKYNVRALCDNLKNDRSVINEILRQTAFVGIEMHHLETCIIKHNENYGSGVINQLTETTEKMRKQLNSMKVRFNNLRAVKEKRSIVLSSENEMKSLRFQQQDILNIIDVTKMRISGTISKITKQLRSISDYNIRVPTPPPFLNIEENV